MNRPILAAALAAALSTLPLIGPAGRAAAQTAAPATTTQSQTKTPTSSAQQAMRERQRKCGAEWKEAKRAGKIEKGTTWPKFWSACNKRLKAAG